MLFAAGVPDRTAMTKNPHVGIASVWWEGNPCNMHLLDMGKTVKKAVADQGMLGWQYNTIGVSDAITMGSEGMLRSMRSLVGFGAGATLIRVCCCRYEVLATEQGNHRRQCRDGYLCAVS